MHFICKIFMYFVHAEDKYENINMENNIKINTIGGTLSSCIQIYIRVHTYKMSRPCMLLWWAINLFLGLTISVLLFFFSYVWRIDYFFYILVKSYTNCHYTSKYLQYKAWLRTKMQSMMHATQELWAKQE